MDDDARALIRNSDVDGVPALLGCVSSTRLEEVVEECAYEGGYTVLHYATDWTVRLIRADDGAEVHTAAFSQRRADCSQFLNIDNDPPKTRERSSLDNLQLRVVAEAVPHALDAEFYCSQLSAREATDLSQYATMPKVSIHYKGGYSDHDPEFTLPAEMAPTPEEPADVALCLGEVKLGRDDELRGYMAVGAYHADGTKLGSWQYEENGHDPSGPGPLPAPGPDWFLDNLGPILGYPAD